MKLKKKEAYTFTSKTYHFFTPISNSEFIVTESVPFSRNDEKPLICLVKDNETQKYISPNTPFIKHSKGLLTYSEGRLLCYDTNDFDNPTEIKIINSFQEREWKTNTENVIVKPKNFALGLSDNNLIPIKVFYGRFRSYRQLSLLKIDFEKKEASIVMSDYKKFITLNKYDVLKQQGYNMDKFDKKYMFSEEKLDDGTLDNYFDHNSQMLFDCSLFKDKKLYFFSPGTRTNYTKYGMDYLTLGILKNKLLNKQYSLEKNLFFQDEDDVDAGKNGKSGRFTSSMKYCILLPYFKTSDTWGSREKLFDLENEKLIDIELPRGYKNHHIIDHLGNSFWSSGRNKNNEFIITRFEIDS